MTAEILHFDGVTSLDISADRVLDVAKAAEMQLTGARLIRVIDAGCG